MATLVPTLTLTSDAGDISSDALNLSVTDSLTINQKVITPSKIKLSTGDLTLFASGSYSRAYVYLNIAPLEFAFFPWHASQNIVATADSGTPYLEYAIFEA